MAGLQTGEGCMTIDSVVWAQYTNVTDRQPRRHSNSCPNAPHQAAQSKHKDFALANGNTKLRNVSFVVFWQ